MKHEIEKNIKKIDTNNIYVGILFYENSDDNINNTDYITIYRTNNYIILNDLKYSIFHKFDTFENIYIDSNNILKSISIDKSAQLVNILQFKELFLNKYDELIMTKNKDLIKKIYKSFSNNETLFNDEEIKLINNLGKSLYYLSYGFSFEAINNPKLINKDYIRTHK